MRKTVFALALLGLVAPAAYAQTTGGAPAEAVKEEVHVSGVRDPDFKPYRTMLLGLDAFEKHHARAPKAQLKYLLRPLATGGDIKGVTLRIENDEGAVPVPVADDGTFVLVRDASMDTKDAEVLTNRKKGAIRWRPHVVSPGVPEGSRRLGDLRAECAVRWAVEKEELSFVQRNVLAAMGACTSKNVHVNYYADGTLANATLREGTRTRELARAGSTRFVPPLHDDTWSDDALIELRYEPPKS